MIILDHSSAKIEHEARVGNLYHEAEARRLRRDARSFARRAGAAQTGWWDRLACRVLCEWEYRRAILGERLEGHLRLHSLVAGPQTRRDLSACCG